nr:acetylornithine transaminase [Corynebacterium aquatimens]
MLQTYPEPPLKLVSGHGAAVTDEQGKDYIDLLAGIAVNSLGHAHPALVDAVAQQAATLGHVSNLFASDPCLEVGAELIKRFGDDSARVYFCNSGGEANEAAVKIARLTGRPRILAAENGFHGRTMGALSITGQPSKRAPFEPLIPGVQFYRYGDIDHLTELLQLGEGGPESVAAIFLEPIQGETGVIPAPEGFLRKVRELCDEHGILMIVDEVQTGVGRTGAFFAHQHPAILGSTTDENGSSESSPIVPDVVTMAKGLGGGLPIGAVIARGEAAKLFTPGSHGTTFGGNPIACAAATAVLSIIDDGFCRTVARRGEELSATLEKIDGVDHVRGSGLMVGVVLDQPVAKKCVELGYEHGVILNAPSDEVVRLTPPLTITDEELKRGVEGFARALADAIQGTSAKETE